MKKTNKLGIEFYFQALSRIISEPRKFFSGLYQELRLRESLGFLFISSIFFTIASLVSNMPSQPFLMGGIFFVNSIGMTFIAAGLGYMVMTMSMGKQVTFGHFFGVYAFSSGVTLLASWVPFFIWLTEPWKWLLIGIGMVKGCGFKVKQAVLIIVISAFILILFFWSVLPLIQLRGS
jgi:hypothetical protein